jgi:hypothetical protein
LGAHWPWLRRIMSTGKQYCVFNNRYLKQKSRAYLPA